MNSLDKRKLALAGGGLALFGLMAVSGPIADIRVTQGGGGSTLSQVEAKVNLGVFAFSYLHSWKRSLR